MPTQQYTEEGYPYLVPDDQGTEPNKLYPTAAVEQEAAPALPVERDPFELAAEHTRKRAPARDPAVLQDYYENKRYQTFPERMVRSAVTLPGDVMSGKVDPLSDEGIARAQDIAGMAVGGPLGAKPGAASLGSGMTRMATNEAGNAPAFYSAVEQAIQKSSQKSATADQWLGFLKNQPGVKPEELQWTVGELPAGQITKAQLEQHIADNKVQLNEIMKGDLKFNKDSKYALPEVVKAAKEAGDTPGDLELTLANDGNAYRALTKKFPELKENEDWAQVVSHNVFGGSSMPTGTSKYHGYQLPGGEPGSYKEMLLTLPNKSKSIIDKYGSYSNAMEKASPVEKQYLEQSLNSNYTNESQYKSSHWDEPNVLAHIRMNDRIINGKKTLHIEEIQSDWHQAGRKQGYQDPAKLNELKNQLESVEKNYQPLIKLPEGFNISKDRNKFSVIPPGQIHGQPYTKLYDSPEAAIAGALDKLNSIKLFEVKEPLINQMNKLHDATVPNAPFKKTWDELALKRIIRKAAEEGYDQISWTPGEAQAARYDLSKQISKVEFIHNRDKVGELKAWDKNGKQVITTPIKNENDLVNTIGKEASEKLMKEENHNGNGIRTLEGEDLKVGGEGMKAFYDKMLVDKANALGKKFGSKVENGYVTEEKNKLIHNKDEASAMAIGAKPVHVMPITPAMKEQALGKGFPLFSAGVPTFEPVQHTPEFDKKSSQTENLDKAQKELKLTPQERNLYKRHLDNLYGKGGVDNKDGTRSTLYTSTVTFGDKAYIVPSVYDGKIVSNEEADRRAKEYGLDKLPSYSSHAEANERYKKLHEYMEKDTDKYEKMKAKLTPVEYNPFANNYRREMNARKYRMNKVDYDPFKT